MPYKSNRFDDRLFRWIGIPAMGMTFYSVSAYVNSSFSRPEDYLVNQVYFIFVAWVLWHGNMRAGYLLKDHINRFENILIKILLRYLVTIIFTFCVSFVLMVAWNKMFQNSSYSYNDLLVVQLVQTIASILIASMYIMIYSNKGKENSILAIERIEKQKIQAQLDALKSQLDPHFIFNSLNTLSYLITSDPAKAKLFNDTLAKVYRYVLINKEKDMVRLDNEMEFAKNNYYLLKIRYQTGLKMCIKMNNLVAEDYLIPPMSLQTLIENAIKHNHFSEKLPLTIEIKVTEENITVTNNRRVKKFEAVSSRIGLVNLKERYKLIVNKHIAIEESNDRFSVFLPLLINEHYDKSFNH